MTGISTAKEEGFKEDVRSFVELTGCQCSRLVEGWYVEGDAVVHTSLDPAVCKRFETELEARVELLWILRSRIAEQEDELERALTRRNECENAIEGLRAALATERGRL